jgi:hypothetical protein
LFGSRQFELLVGILQPVAKKANRIIVLLCFEPRGGRCLFWWLLFGRFGTAFLTVSVKISLQRGRVGGQQTLTIFWATRKTSLCAGHILGENYEKTTIGDWPDSLDGHHSCGTRDWRDIFAV